MGSCIYWIFGKADEVEDAGELSTPDSDTEPEPAPPTPESAAKEPSVKDPEIEPETSEEVVPKSDVDSPNSLDTE